MGSKAPPAFLFLDPISRPGSNERALKKARSHLTTHQHQRRRNQEPEAFETLGPRRKSLKSLRRCGTEKREDEKVEEEILDHRRNVALQSADLSDPLTAAFRGGSLAFQLYILNDPANTVGKILSGVGTNAISVLRCYEELILIQAPEFERQYAHITRPGVAYKHLFPSVFKEPALLASCMLLALSRLIATSQKLIEPRTIQFVLQLRGFVLRGINQALEDQSRARSDEMLAAVLLLATFEALHGLVGVYPVHMMGLMDMVNYRGGFKALGFEGCAEAFIRWQDANIAHIVGGKTYSHLGKNKSLLPEVKADKDQFLAGAALTTDSFAEQSEGRGEDNAAGEETAQTSRKRSQ